MDPKICIAIHQRNNGVYPPYKGGGEPRGGTTFPLAPSLKREPRFPLKPSLCVGVWGGFAPLWGFEGGFAPPMGVWGALPPRVWSYPIIRQSTVSSTFRPIIRLRIYRNSYNNPYFPKQSDIPYTSPPACIL